MARSARQIAAQRKAALASARKRRRGRGPGPIRRAKFNVQGHGAAKLNLARTKRGKRKIARRAAIGVAAVGIGVAAVHGAKYKTNVKVINRPGPKFNSKHPYAKRMHHVRASSPGKTVHVFGAAVRRRKVGVAVKRTRRH